MFLWLLSCESACVVAAIIKICQSSNLLRCFSTLWIFELNCKSTVASSLQSLVKSLLQFLHWFWIVAVWSVGGCLASDKVIMNVINSVFRVIFISLSTVFYVSRTALHLCPHLFIFQYIGWAVIYQLISNSRVIAESAFSCLPRQIHHTRVCLLGVIRLYLKGSPLSFAPAGNSRNLYIDSISTCDKQRR